MDAVRVVRILADKAVFAGIAAAPVRVQRKAKAVLLVLLGAQDALGLLGQNVKPVGFFRFELC
jgi:hypothetical protein